MVDWNGTFTLLHHRDWFSNPFYSQNFRRKPYVHGTSVNYWKILHESGIFSTTLLMRIHTHFLNKETISKICTYVSICFSLRKIYKYYTQKPYIRCSGTGRLSMNFSIQNNNANIKLSVWFYNAIPNWTRTVTSNLKKKLK